MNTKSIVMSCILILLLVSFADCASVGTDGGITLHITFAGDLATDMVTDAGGNPVNNPATGTQWQARDKLEHDLQLFAEHLYQMSEGKHYLRNVIVIDNDRSGDNADIRWSNEAGASNAFLNAWDDIEWRINIRRAWRDTIHEVVTHELGHYFYGLSDEYATANASRDNYYQGYFPGTADFTVTITGDCVNTVMNDNSPFQFCDDTDHSLTVDYTHPTSGTDVTGEFLTPALLDDGNANNDGPINNWIDQPFAMDGWSVAELNHTDLVGHHTDGTRPAFNAASVPDLTIEYVEQVLDAPGRILLLDRSGSMSHESFGIQASQYVQEAGLFLYHSSEADDYIGAFVYNAAVEEFFAYDKYDNNNNLLNFYIPTGLTNIYKALKAGLDALEAEHGDDNVAGGELFLMSDGRQTTGGDLWDEVDRAKDLGVTIHTFSYGAADQVVMDQIAAETNGEEFLMSEQTDNLMNLKMRIVRSLSKIRGLIPVYDYYGELQKSGVDEKEVEYMNISFNVPHNCRKLKFYVFPEQPYGEDHRFKMKHDTSGFEVQSVPSQISRRGRLSGQRAKNPQSGQWTVTIHADLKYKKLPPGNVQLLAYVDNPEIDTHVWMDQQVITVLPECSKQRKVYASVANMYPLTNVKTQAYFTDPSGKKIVDVQMTDDGRNGDVKPSDGIYTGLVDTRWLMKMSKALRFNLKATFEITKESVPAPNIEYEPGTDFEKLLKSYVSDSFEATAERGIVLTTRSTLPKVKLLKGAGAKVFRSDRDSLTIRLYNAFPNPESVRANLGKGITVTKIESNRPGGKYTIKYTISRTAVPGSRTLYLQFGSTKLQIENAILVSAKKKTIFDVILQLVRHILWF